MKNKLLFLILVFMLSFNFASAFLVSDQGTDVREISTGNLTALANFTISIYDEPTAGNLIFQQTFENGIVNGSWNVMINPDLEYGKNYWKDYEINQEDLDFDGNERLEFQSSAGMINNITFVNLSLINSCPAGSSIRLIYNNGSVLCEEDDSGSGSADLTDYALKNQSEVFQGNITTSHTGFFGWLGSLISRINKLFVQDIEFNGTINGSGNIITNQNVTATYFIGNGSYLTGISQDSYDDSWINSTVDNKILTNNNSLNSYILWVNSTNAGGGISGEYDPYWTANYTAFNNSWSSTFNQTVNNSINNYILYVNSTNPSGAETYNDAWINTTMDSKLLLNNQSVNNYIYSNNDSIENYILYVNSTNNAGGTDTFIANYSQFLLNNESLTNYINSNNNSIINYILLVNTSMQNYLNYQNTSTTNLINSNNQSVTNYISSIAASSEASWNANYSTFLTHMPYSAWNATNTSYITGDNFTSQNNSINNYISSNNNSINNYILYVNSTNGAGSGGELLWNANYSNVAFENQANVFGAYNQSFDSNTLFIDSNNDRIGINTNLPNESLYVVGKIFASENFKFNDTNESVLIGTDTGGTQFATTALGLMAAYNNNGSYVTAVGDSAADRNIADRLTAIGYISGYYNTGYYLTAMGYQSGAYNTGDYVTAMGPLAGAGSSLDYSNTGDYLTATGFQAGAFNKGNYVTATGSFAAAGNGVPGFYNTGNYTTAMGYASGYNNKGSSLTAMGYASGYSNNGSYVTAVGYNSSKFNRGNYSSGFGYQTLMNNSGNNVVAIGYQAGLNNLVDNQFIIQQTNVNEIPLIQGNFLSGNLGIATSNPQQKLHVNGSILANGTINATTDICIEGGNCLSNVTAGSSYNDAWINQTFYNRTDVNLNISNANTSMQNYVNLQNTSQTNYINSNNQSITNAINAVAASGETNWNANYSTFLTHMPYSAWNATNTSYMTGDNFTSQNNSINNYISSNNNSINNYILYVNSTNPSGAEAYNDAWINQTIYNKTQVEININNSNFSTSNFITSNNASIINWATSTFVSILNILNLVGNWSADKSNYYNTTQVDDINTSMQNYVNLQNTSQTNYINYNNQSVTNYISSIASIGEPNWNANYSTFLTHITWDNVMNGTLMRTSQWNSTNTSYMLISNWNATNTSYMAGDNFTLQNTSLRNYILYVNSTNGVGGSESLWNANFTAFNSSWSSTYNSTYNTWAYNQTAPANSYTDSRTSISGLHTHDASNITSPIWVNKTGDTMSGNLNMSSNNITAVDCITFASGGKICSG